MTPHTDTVTFSDLVKTVKQVVNADGTKPRAICFDYFDTLVFRTVAPEATKKIAAYQLSLLLGTLSGEVIYGIRRQLELKLCREKQAEGQDPEFSLVVLAGHLYRLLVAMSDNSILLAVEEQFVHRFCEIEVAVEKEVQQPYLEMVELLVWLKSRSVETYLISDFYIPQEYFEMMLSHHGLAEFFSEIFISVNYGLTKGSSKLYGEVCRKLGYRPEQLWMIGDNFHADKIMAERAGLKAFLVDITEQKKDYEDWQERSKTVKARERSLGNIFENILSTADPLHFPEMSATLWLFINRLFDYLASRQVTNVFFCSKEGEFLMRLFSAYQKKMFGGTLISSHYLLVSRKATFICSLQPLQQETFSRLFEQYRDLTLTEFVLSLNFSKIQLAELMEHLAVDWEVRIANLQHHEHFRALLGLSQFQELYEQYRREQRQNFLEYLDSFGVNYRIDGLHLVDVGWKGSIQNNIYFALAEEVPVHGCYLGLLSPSCLTAKNLKKGILFTDHPQLSPYVHVYNNNRSLFEMILGASHGSADGYFSDSLLAENLEGRGSVVMKNTFGVRPVAVTTLDFPEERRLFEEQILPLQKAYFSMFDQMTGAVLAQHCPAPEPLWFAQRHARMLFRPKQVEVDFFSRLYHLENFGLFEFTAFASEERQTFLNRLHNFLRLIQNPEAYLETGVWPPIILRRLGLSLLQPIDGWKRYRRIFVEQ